MPGPRRTTSGAVREQALRWLPVVVPVAAIVYALVWVLPRSSRNALVETAIWSLLVVVAFGGWGSLVRFFVARRERVDLGLRVVWGASATCALGGLLAAFAAMGHGSAVLLVEGGVVLALAALVVERATVRVRARAMIASAVREPRLAVVGALLAGIVAIHYLAGIAEPFTHPYDDDIAYLAFVKKMLDTGTLVEPFSLRRLSALGGQTFFLELVAARAAPSQANTFDRSICVLMVVLLVTGYRDRARRPPWVVVTTTIGLFLTLPSTAINTASYYSGVAFFLGLFRTMVWASRHSRREWQSALPLALVGAATCTLRQNYMLVAAAALAAMYVFRVFASREALRARIVEPLVAAGLSVAALLPWLVVSWHSNRTLLYPLMLGTANPAMLFQSDSSTLLRELHLQLWTALEGIPLKTAGLFVIAAVLVRETDPRRPLGAFLIGTAVGFVLLVHSLTQGEPGNIGRYAFGFVIALCIAVVLAASTAPLTGVIRRPRIAAGLAIFAVLAGLIDARNGLYKFYARGTRNIEALHDTPPRSQEENPPEHGLYLRLQEAVPAGARLAVMLDEPYHLNFSRNPIWNLDMPGYSSLAPGIPYFKGSERLEEYFHGIGVRYVAFVRPQYSRYQYRRAYWVQMVVDEQEVWRAHAPYVIDFVDNLTAIEQRHRRAFEERGLVVVDLEAQP